MNKEQLKAIAKLKSAFEVAEDVELRLIGTIVHDGATAESDDVLLDCIFATDGDETLNRVELLGNAYVVINKEELVDAMELYIKQRKGKKDE